MIRAVDKLQCYGCGACKNVCPNHCIKMEVNQKGFDYPSVDMEHCIQCGACLKACPAMQRTLEILAGNKQTAYAAVNLDDFEHTVSSSGGIQVAIANEVLREGGIVFGAAFDENIFLKTQHARNREELLPLIGSKYVQCNTGDAYSKIKDYLVEGRLVFYCATPCQIAGLNTFLGKSYDNLITADFVCQGVPSPVIFRDYLDYIESLHNDKIVKFKFRDKTVSARACKNIITFRSGKTIAGPTWEFPYRKIFIPNISVRDSCYQCEFATDRRVSDITLADFQAIHQLNPALNVNMQYSTIITNTKKGERMLEQIKGNLELIGTTMEFLKTFHARLNEPAQRNEKTEAFWEDYASKPIDYVLSKYTSTSYFHNMEEIELAIVRNILHLASHKLIEMPITEERLLAMWDDLSSWILIPIDSSYEEYEATTKGIKEAYEYGRSFIRLKAKQYQ